MRKRERETHTNVKKKEDEKKQDCKTNGKMKGKKRRCQTK